MTKSKLSILTIIFCALMGCKKDAPTKAAQTNDDNSWTIGTEQNIVSGSTRMDIPDNNKKALVFQTTKTPTLYVIFKSIPTKSGTYKMVDKKGESFADDECTVGGLDSNGEGFYYYYNGEKTAPSLTATVTNGKVSLKIPEIKVTFAQPSPVFNFKASLQEK